MSLYDDDTNQPINLSGITTLTNPNGISNNNWAITNGQINTTSSTVFFTPGYPVGNELLAATFVVAPGLGFLSGDPITITDVDGSVQMVGYVTSYSPATGTLVAQIGLNFQMEIRAYDRYRGVDDYSPWYDWGGAPSSLIGGPPLILATLGQGLMMTDVGYLQVMIPAVMMQQLRHRTYMCAMAVTDTLNTRQVFIAELPILYGGMEIATWVQPMAAPTV